MPCYSPIPAWQADDGQILFVERGSILRSLSLPCGQCIGCRLERSRQWAVRCVHESQLHDSNCFVTLTYDDDHIPHDFSLNYRHFQLFMKRLRKSTADPVRFYMCGEYGDQTFRPHYHACLFNCSFADRQFFSNLSSGSKLYTSDNLSKLWPHGHSSIGDVTFESAAYVARYICKKVTGPAANDHYSRIDPYTGEIYQVVPDFSRMSLKPGIGANWFQRYRSDVYADGMSADKRDSVVIRGVRMKPPRYYDKLLASADDYSSDYIEYLRSVTAAKNAANNTPAQLFIRETYTLARISFLKRTL